MYHVSEQVASEKHLVTDQENCSVKNILADKFLIKEKNLLLLHSLSCIYFCSFCYCCDY